MIRKVGPITVIRLPGINHRRVDQVSVSKVFGVCIERVGPIVEAKGFGLRLTLAHWKPSLGFA